MGETLKNKITYELNDDIANFFTLPIEETEPKVDYKVLKAQIYQMKNIDKEEKANIINKINSLTINKPDSKQEVIIKEIEEFKNKYGL